MKLLLTSIFGPYGVDDQFGRKENLMEIMHNQVTKGQSAFSPRMNVYSNGLYLIAQNIDIPTVVLDFPSLPEFIEEIKKGYEYIGISFIFSNIEKTAHMATLIRQHAPKTKIIIGGHGAALDNIRDLIDCDYACKGEGVRWFRKFFNEELDRPITQPHLFASFNKYVMGLPIKQDTAVIMPGVGCINACKFCSTSHFFQKEYSSFFKNTEELFKSLCEISDNLKTDEFFVFDENFMKNIPRAKELYELMVQHKRFFRFNIFSSAETILSIGYDFLANFGVQIIWIGVESKNYVFEKNKGANIKEIVLELKNRGISVLASLILFMEHHTKENIWEDIDFLLDVAPDMSQFMQLGPVPSTALYEEYKQLGKLLPDVPFKDKHGQDQIWFTHPHFTKEESRVYLDQAFKKEYQELGPTLLRMAETTFRGLKYFESKLGRTEVEEARYNQFLMKSKFMGSILGSVLIYAPSSVKSKTISLIKEYLVRFKNPIYFSIATIVSALSFQWEKLVYTSGRRIRQPKKHITSYRMTIAKVQKEVKTLANAYN